jgi:hypothetical protein
MIEARLAGDYVEIELTGRDAFSLFWKTSWSLQVPLDDVVRASTSPTFDQARRCLNEKASESRRTNGLLVCAHRGAPTLDLDVSAPPYARIVLGVPDPAGTARDIEAALASRSR